MNYGKMLFHAVIAIGCIVFFLKGEISAAVMYIGVFTNIGIVNINLDCKSR